MLLSLTVPLMAPLALASGSLLAPAELTPFQTNRKSPPGMTLVQGGTHGTDLAFYPPPAIPLNTQYPNETLQMLKYAGLQYHSPESKAAQFADRVFKAGRNFARAAHFDGVTFDWDHVLSNYKIFEPLWDLLRVKMSKERPSEKLRQSPMTAIEVARPFMQELALGMMVGYAQRQGLTNFDQWEQYQPQVRIVTHTWPDRIGILARDFMRLLPLMQGLLPGTPEMYERVTDPKARAFVNLHHFLDYAESLMKRYQDGGFSALKPHEQDATLAYFEDGKAHYRKPVEALALHGWETSSLLHFDDSSRIIRDLNPNRANDKIEGLLVRQPYLASDRSYHDVSETDKIAISLPFRSRQGIIRAVANKLAWIEWSSSTIDAILGALQAFGSDDAPPPDLMQLSTLKEGLVLMVHETPTTLGAFWEQYVEPTNRAKTLIRKIRKEKGGIKAIRKAHEAALAAQRQENG